MKRFLTIVLVVLTTISLITLTGCGNENKLIGTWSPSDGTGSKIVFYEGGTGYWNEGFTWEIKGNIVTIHTEDSRKTHSYTGPATGRYNQWTTGSAPRTYSYKLDKSSNPYKLEAINGDTDFIKSQ